MADRNFRLIRLLKLASQDSEGVFPFKAFDFLRRDRAL